MAVPMSEVRELAAQGTAVFRDVPTIEKIRLAVKASNRIFDESSWGWAGKGGFFLVYTIPLKSYVNATPNNFDDITRNAMQDIAGRWPEATFEMRNCGPLCIFMVTWMPQELPADEPEPTEPECNIGNLVRLMDLQGDWFQLHEYRVEDGAFYACYTSQWHYGSQIYQDEQEARRLNALLVNMWPELDVEWKRENLHVKIHIFYGPKEEETLDSENPV